MKTIMGGGASRKTSSWPRYNWILIALQLLSAAVVLVCLGWYGLNDRSGLPSDFMCWLPGVAVCYFIFSFPFLHRGILSVWILKDFVTDQG